jgi:hypothetical protein
MAVREGSGRALRLAVVALSLTMLPACQGAGLFQRRQALRPVPDAGAVAPPVVPYSAYRPAYAPGPPKRTLLLGGYAGYNYAPLRVQEYVPTTFGVESWGYPEGHGSKGAGFWHR